MKFMRDKFGNLVNLELVKAISKREEDNVYRVMAYYTDTQDKMLGEFNNEKDANVYMEQIKAKLAKVNGLIC